MMDGTEWGALRKCDYNHNMKHWKPSRWWIFHLKLATTWSLAPFSLSPSQAHQPWWSAQKVNETTPALKAQFLNRSHTHRHTYICAHPWIIHKCFSCVYSSEKKGMPVNEIKQNSFHMSLTVYEWISVAQIWHCHGNNKFTHYRLPYIVQHSLKTWVEILQTQLY